MPRKQDPTAPDFYLKASGAAITPSEREMIKDQAALIAKSASPKYVAVNIGVQRGATMHCIRAGAPKCRLVGVDSNPKWLHPLFEGYLRPVGLVLGDSGAPETQDQCQEPVHLLLVDGDHRFRSVLEDIRGWVPKVAVGGVVMFHDFSHPKGDIPRLRGVRMAVEEWQAAEGWPDQWRECAHVDSIIAFERFKDGPAILPSLSSHRCSKEECSCVDRSCCKGLNSTSTTLTPCNSPEEAPTNPE